MKNANLIVISIVLITLCFSVQANTNQDKDYILRKSYGYYKKEFITREGRVMDPERNDITTSEGQSYLLQRAAANNDIKTFNLAYNWAKKHLQRSDNLFAWFWGKDKNGKYMVLDRNSAADADVNIAFALIMAYELWGNKKYLEEAKPIISSIWKNETKKIGKYRVLMPGFVQTRVERIEINPSYFHPYAFKFFKKYGPEDDWDIVVESSYYYIMEVSAKTVTGLPPNWFLIKNGEIGVEDTEKSDFSYDAIRVFKKIYWDYIRTGDKRDLPILEKAKFFIPKWKKSRKFYTNYKADGTLRDTNEFIGAIAILILPISIYDKATAAEIFKEKIEPYVYDKNNWIRRKDYYGKNLLWYGRHFYYKESTEYKRMEEMSKRLNKKD